MEQAIGGLSCNILAVLQKEKGITLQEASDMAGARFKALVDQFEAAASRLPSFGKEMDETVG